MANTVLANLINPQVMADMISAKIANAIVVTPFAKIDTTLVDQPGNTITVPQYGFIGEATDIAEGSSDTAAQMSTSAVTYTVKKAMKSINLSDEAVLSGYGNPVGEANSQIGKAIASKIDSDSLAALKAARKTHSAGAKISYSGIVDAIDVFAEEMNTEKVIFVNPAQVTTLRKDTNFISADKYAEGKGALFNGEIGRIANTRIVPSRKVAQVASYYVYGTSSDTAVTSNNLATVQATLPGAKVGDYVAAVNTAGYQCPIVKIETDVRTEDEIPALTIFMKRDVNVETERHTLSRTTDISADEHYVAALTNAEKVVLACFNA